PVSAESYRLALLWLRTEPAGGLFQSMKAKLAGIASHTGMSGVFRLQGSDVYRVLEITPIPGKPLPAGLPRRSPLSGLRACAEKLTAVTDLEMLLEQVLSALQTQFGIRH